MDLAKDPQTDRSGHRETLDGPGQSKCKRVRLNLCGGREGGGGRQILGAAMMDIARDPQTDLNTETLSGPGRRKCKRVRLLSLLVGGGGGGGQTDIGRGLGGSCERPTDRQIWTQRHWMDLVRVNARRLDCKSLLEGEGGGRNRHIMDSGLCGPSERPTDRQIWTQRDTGWTWSE